MSIIYQTRNEKYRFFLSHNNTFLSHLHRQTEMIIVLSGFLLLTVDGDTINLQEGQFFIIFPNQIHHLETPVTSDIALLIFDADFCPAFQQMFLNFQPLLTPLNTDSLSVHGQTALTALRRLHDSHLRDAHAEDPQLLLTRGYLHLLLADIRPLLTLSARTEHTDLELSQQILLYIQSHYTEDITLDILAKEFHASRFTVSRIFSGRLHTSLPAFLTEFRLEHALHMLSSEPSMNVTEIAFASGFASTRSFFRSFQKAYGMSPGKYRKITK